MTTRNSSRRPRTRSPRLEKIFAPGGTLDRRLPGYEFRPTQLKMAEAVAEAIDGKRHLCVEAGTGTGKTLAYLIPALLSGRKTFVATATKNLQDQLISKDIPFLREHLFPRLSVSCMKGRQNYLCLRRLYEERTEWLPLGDLQEQSRRLGTWAASTETGDRAELDWLSSRDPLWQALDARSEICIGQNCDYFDECFVTRMRRQAFEADLIVSNHALLFASLALESDEIGRVLPDFSVVIVDEAHEMEGVAANHFGNGLSSYQLAEFIRDFQRAFHNVPRLGSTLEKLNRHVEAFFRVFPDLEGKHSLNFYRSPWGEEIDLRDQLLPRYQRLRNTLQLLRSEMEAVKERPPEWEPLARRLASIKEVLDLLFLFNEPDQVYWFEQRGRGTFLRVTPIDIRRNMQEKLYSRCDSAILTSATLATGSDFSFFKQRTGLPDPDELILPGEFDYPRQAILYVPSCMPAPQSPGHAAALLKEIEALLEITQGGTFLLFTSIQQMERVYNCLKVSSTYPLFRQGERPRNQLLELFRETSNSVLCATASFWQGVDVKGEALRSVIIDKLPFQVPTEPVVAARIHRLQQNGNNAFLEYMLPEAIITLKQGLGRLIRSRQDRGILAVLDVRLRTKSYGREFLESLPNCTLTDNMNLLRNFFRGRASAPTGGN